METGGLIGFWSSPETRSIIQSIQTGEISIGSGSSSNTATISAVNTKYAVCFYNGYRSADTSLSTSEDYPRVSLTNATTVTAQTNASNAGSARIVRFTVVEFKPFAVKSVQQGTITISGSSTSATATINSVNTARSFVMHIGQNQTVHSVDYNYNQGRLVLTDATTVTATKDNGLNPSLVVGYVVVEFNALIVKSIQAVTLSMAASASQADATITAVNDTSSMLIWGGWNLSSFASGNPARHPHVYRTSTTNVRATRGAVSSTTETIQCSVVEFELRWIKSRQAGQTVIASSGSSANATISTVDTSKSLLTWMNNTGSSSNTGNEWYSTAKINSSTQVTIERGATPTITSTVSWEVIEFI